MRGSYIRRTEIRRVLCTKDPGAIRAIDSLRLPANWKGVFFPKPNSNLLFKSLTHKTVRDLGAGVSSPPCSEQRMAQSRSSCTTADAVCNSLFVLFIEVSFGNKTVRDSSHQAQERSGLPTKYFGSNKNLYASNGEWLSLSASTWIKSFVLDGC